MPAHRLPISSANSFVRAEGSAAVAGRAPARALRAASARNGSAGRAGGFAEEARGGDDAVRPADGAVVLAEAVPEGRVPSPHPEDRTDTASSAPASARRRAVRLVLAAVSS